MKIRSWLVAIALLTLAATANATIFYVNTDSYDFYDGLTWATAKKTIQAGIDASQPGDEVHVMYGVYNECITLKSGVDLKGGYFGTTERDWTYLPSIIDGNQGEVVVSMPADATSTTGIDGFVIQNGHSWGISCQGSGSSPRIANNNITKNGNIVSGGAIFVGGNSPKISNNLVASNMSCCLPNNPGYGIIHINGLGSPQIINDTIVDNVGSAIHCGGTPTIYNNIISNNSRAFYKSADTQTTPVAGNNCVYGNSFDNSMPGEHNVYLDPKMDSAFHPNAAYGLTISFYNQIPRIQTNSPCIDAGLDEVVESGNTDINGRTRLQGSHVDIGADEYNGTFTTRPIIKVSTSGNDANDGLTWATAKKTIKAGLDAAFTDAYGTGWVGEVWVAKGNYPESLQTNSNIDLYGGFDGTETDRNQRDWRKNETVIDGNNYDSTIMVCDSARIDGFTVRNGYSWGISCFGIFAPTIINNIITQNGNNLRGGAISASNSSIQIVNNLIINNQSSIDKSAYPVSGIIAIVNSNYMHTQGKPLIANNTIVNNTGTALYVVGWNGGVNAAVYNNIIAYNDRFFDSAAGGYGSPFTNNCIYGNTTNVTLPPLSENIYLDPKLAYTSKGIPHIQPDSPCVDAGYDEAIQPGWVDIDGQYRVSGNHIDIGADESDGTKWENDTPTIRVSPSGNDSNDGFTWETAKKTVSAGIKATIPGNETWVAAGSYVECINISKNIGVYGGFSGTETKREQRNWKVNTTILDGNQKGSVITASNSLIPSTKVIIDGFTIQHGSGTNNRGGGIYCNYCNLSIRNNRINNNSATYGGGICVAGDNSVLEGKGNYITCNTGGSGTVLKIMNSSIISSLIGNVICKNTGTSASTAVISVAGKNSTIINNTIVDNIGKGIDNNILSATISNNIIALNDTGVSSSYAITITNNSVFGNTTNYSGTTISNVDTIEADPLFVDRANGDYRLSAGSPCINKGLNSAVSSLFDIDGQGRIAKGIVDIGADEYWSTTMYVSDAKNAPDTALISGTGATISAAFPDFFYIESDDRSSGIRVEKTGHQLTKGMKADISGTVSTTIDGERCIIADSAVENGSGSILPLGMNNRGLSSPIGLNSSGLLVRVWGTVTQRGDGYFYIDDGAQVKDGTTTCGDDNIGIRVIGSNSGHFVVVIGISSLIKTDDGKVIRVIRPLN